MRTILALLPCLALVPAATLAQGGPTLALPAGCEAFLTVQSKGCMVTHYFTCEGDPEGWQRRVDMVMDGPTYAATVDSETQWIESADLSSGVLERLEEEPRDRASFSVLIEEGTDTYDFRTLSDQVGQQRYVGFDALTGVTQVIDGVELEQTEYEITAYDAAGEVMWESEGRQWISRDYRMFLSGQSAYTSPQGDFEVDNTPVAFILPGEPGFLGSFPRYDCGETASLPLPAPGGERVIAARGAAP
jgi:hypothetical protein